MKANHVALTFHDASCVLVGTFNIYIIRPDWLVEIGVVKKGELVKFESNLSQPGLRMSASAIGTWVVSPNRLIIKSEERSKDLGEMIDRVIQTLPWTPLYGLGANVTYRGSRDDVDEWATKTAFPPEAIESGDGLLKQRTWHLGLQRNEVLVNLQLDETSEYAELSSNVHVELTSKDRPGAHGQSIADFASQHARRFFEYRELAERLSSKYFGAQIHAVHNE